MGRDIGETTKGVQLPDIYTIPSGASMDAVWSELVYTEARLLKSRDAEDLRPAIAALLTELDRIRAGQYAVWRAEIVAEAGVAAANDDIDDDVADIDRRLQGAIPGTAAERRKSPRYKRYFREAPSATIRLGLKSELEKVGTWPASLRTEPEAALQEAGVTLEGHVTVGRTALTERSNAAGATADHRVREIVSLIDDVNGARRSIFGVLVQRAAERGLPADWPHRFFRTSTRGSSRSAPTPTTSEPTE